MLAENIKSWFEEHEAIGQQKGEAIGRQQGEARALQRMISRRFGAIPAEIAARIAGAAPEQIEIWLDQVSDGASLDDMFGPTTH